MARTNSRYELKNCCLYLEENIYRNNTHSLLSYKINSERKICTYVQCKVGRIEGNAKDLYTQYMFGYLRRSNIISKCVNSLSYKSN